MKRMHLLPRTLFTFAVLVAAGWPANGSRAADAPAKSKTFAAPHHMVMAVEMIGPVTQETDLQIICVLQHEAGRDRYIEAMDDFNVKLGHLLSSLRDRGEFVGNGGETLLFTPPRGSITPKRVLLIGVGKEADLSLDALSLAGRIAVREAVRLGARHVSFAPTLRDQGSSRIDVGDGDRVVAEQVILAYDTEKRLQEQGLAPAFDLQDWTIEAGPAYFDAAAEKVGTGVATAAAAIQKRPSTAYRH